MAIMTYAIRSSDLIGLLKGESSPPEDGLDPADEHLPASGDRPDAESHHTGPDHAPGFEVGNRRYHHHERQPPGCSGSDVRCSHPKSLAEGEEEEKK